MRQWLVDPKIMCRQHLLGEHVEHHMFVGSINKGVDATGYLKTGLLDISKLRSRHEELVAEMLRRGMNHKSPLLAVDPAQAAKYDFITPCINVEENYRELHRRCEVCRSNIIAALGRPPEDSSGIFAEIPKDLASRQDGSG